MKNIIFIILAFVAVFLYRANDPIATYFNPDKLIDTLAYDSYIDLRIVLLNVLIAIVTGIAIFCLSKAFYDNVILVILLTILFSYSTSDLFAIFVLKEKYFQGIKDYIGMIIMAILAIYKFRKKLVLYINSIKK